LKFGCRIKLKLTGIAPALALGHHNQRTVALRAAKAQQHDPVIESPCLIDVSLYGTGHIKGKLNNIHLLDSFY
jgi:hypothetical protein